VASMIGVRMYTKGGMDGGRGGGFSLLITQREVRFSTP